MPEHPARFAQLLRRSAELQEALADSFEDVPFAQGRGQTAAFALRSSLDHGIAVQRLIGEGLAIPGTASLRLQFEALVRGIWLIFAASDQDVAKLAADLDPDSDLGATRLPMAADMLKALGSSSSVPPVALLQLQHFRDAQWKPLCSYVHSGLHSIARQRTGFPLQLAEQLVRSSNGLSTMAAMSLAIAGGWQRTAASMGQIQRTFADCLPPMSVSGIQPATP